MMDRQYYLVRYGWFTSCHSKILHEMLKFSAFSLLLGLIVLLFRLLQFIKKLSVTADSCYPEYKTQLAVWNTTYN